MKFIRHFDFQTFAAPLRERRGIYLEKRVQPSPKKPDEQTTPDAPDVIEDILNKLKELIESGSFLDKLEEWNAYMREQVTNTFRTMYPDRYGTINGPNEAELTKRIDDIILGIKELLPAQIDVYDKTNGDEYFTRYDNIFQEFGRSQYTVQKGADSLTGAMAKKADVFDDFSNLNEGDALTFKNDTNLVENGAVDWLQDNGYKFTKSADGKVRIHKDGTDPDKDDTIVENGLKKIWCIHISDGSGGTKVDGVVTLDGDGDMVVYKEDARRITELLDAPDASGHMVEQTVIGNADKMTNATYKVTVEEEAGKLVQKVEKVMGQTDAQGIYDKESDPNDPERQLAFDILEEARVLAATDGTTKDDDLANRINDVKALIEKSFAPNSWGESIRGATGGKKLSEVTGTSSGGGGSGNGGPKPKPQPNSQPQLDQSGVDTAANRAGIDTSKELSRQDIESLTTEITWEDGMENITFGSRKVNVLSDPDKAKISEATAKVAAKVIYMVNKNLIQVNSTARAQLASFNRGKRSSDGYDQLGSAVGDLHKYLVRNPNVGRTETGGRTDTPLGMNKSDLENVIRAETSGNPATPSQINTIVRNIRLDAVDFTDASVTEVTFGADNKNLITDTALHAGLGTDADRIAKEAAITAYLMKEGLISLSGKAAAQWQAFQDGDTFYFLSGAANNLGSSFDAVHSFYMK